MKQLNLNRYSNPLMLTPWEKEIIAEYKLGQNDIYEEIFDLEIKYSKTINKINKVKNAIMISENLIKTKGFEDVVIFSNDDSISVIINKDELQKEDIAQIQSIIAREIGAKIEDIHIMNK